MEVQVVQLLNFISFSDIIDLRRSVGLGSTGKENKCL